jgi:hypothetical protein
MRANYGSIRQGPIAVRLSESDKAKLAALAKKSAGGNASTVIRALVRWATPTIVEQAIQRAGENRQRQPEQGAS